MMNMEKFCSLIETEIQKIADKGLNAGNLDTAYKLVDIYKDLKNTEYWDMKNEYYEAVLSEMQGGYSQEGYSQRRGQRRDSMGRYSREGGYANAGYEQGSSYARRGEGQQMRGGYSRNGGYSQNGYSETYDRYMDSKQSFRANKSGDCKQRLMQTLEEYMQEFTGQMEEMLRDSDCAEERTTIQRYLGKLKNITV